MNVQISSVNMRYRDNAVSSVQVHFNGNDDGRTISVNGYIPLTVEEYRGNEDVDVLENIVREAVAERILAEEDNNNDGFPDEDE